MAAGNVNPFNVSDSEEEAEQRQDDADTERSPSDEAQGHSLGPFSPPAYSEPAVLLSSNRTSPSVDGIPASAAAVAGIGGGGAETRVSLDAIAAQLLRDQYILTALELHTELLEAGRELPRLRDYFSNPGNFERQSGTPPACKEQGVGPGGPLNRAGSISTLDSLDFARYSDDGNRESDEKVAECEIPSQERKNYKSSPEIQEPIRTLEKRALNFLVNEYLLKNEYKLTSITFSDENDDQDFELWDDVGLNIPKPPDLLQLYRNCGNSLPLHRDTVDVAVNVDPNDLPGDCFTQEPVQQTEAVQQQEVVQELEYQISLLNSEKQSLAEQIKKLQSDVQALQRNVSSEPTSAVKLIQSKEDTPCGKPPLDNGQYLDIRGVTEMDSSSDANTTKTSTTTTATTDCTESTTTATQPYSKLKSQQGKTSVQFDQPNRKLSPVFHQALLSFCRMSADSRLGSEVSRIADSEQSVMLMLGRCLPHIVPNVLLAKRERMVVHLCQELIPLILCTACLHPEPKERDQLLHILFNLIKRPDDEQRQMILTGCVAFARHVGPTRVEAELLPQCWEQINHKYPERRLLVAEACGALAPYLPKEIRSSLVLSMLQQMLAEDKADMVREAVVKSLGIIMGYIDDPDKYFQGFELMLLSLGDPSERVVSATHQVFIPAFAAWCTELGNLQSQLIPSLLTRIEKLLKQGEYGLDEHKLHMYLSALQSLIPSLFAVLLQNAPFTSRAKLQGDVPPIEVTRFPRPVSPLQDVATIVGSREQLAVLLQLYDHQLQHEGTTGWDSLLWVVNQFLPQLIDIVGRISVTSSTCVHEFSRFFWRLCRTFGKIFTNTKVKPQFQEILRLSEENVDASAGNGVLTKATVPIYATGVLTCYNQEEDRKLLVGFLEDVMTTLSLSHAPLDSLKASFVELGANPAYHELLLTVLWYGVVHTSALVRCTAARMFELLVKGVNETLVAQRVVPALITLSSDPEISVRISTIPAFGTIMETVTQKELLERVKMQLASFLEDPQYQDQHSLHMEIIKTFGRVGPNAEPRFRDEFVLPHLHKLTLCNNQQTVESKRIDIATQLFEAYSALSCCFISEELMINHFLPGLRCLRTDMEQLSPEHEVILSSMIKECEIKVENKGIGEAQGSISIAASLVGEDAKTKFLSKMGQLTTSGAMLANVFQRKK
ncbi:lisH domain and HEAT repeat-containing protein KIAA1468 homolog isoform X6 [Sinocyclocheilus anshuiensis]|uniref:lisH domain and HEAT repeat-containing protein KIAA1468 homolog isoform X6 n=1 Tax=Sinocyclocheilus anshuiensis TaxID=1608454 RepID=UPI0007B85BCE|nr:PREDICTED: lisH domain and HEAT repeat-containing protein KIAA1468 homolog isoform X6 [Sinocyclocheilus anshuiensis]